MAWLEGSNHGTLNSTTEVVLVAAPGASVRRVIVTLEIHNRDTAPVTLTVRYKDGGTTRQIRKVTLASLDTYQLSGRYVLDTTSKSITAVLSGAPATTQPDFVATYGDAS